MPRWTKLARTLLVTVAPAGVRQVLGVTQASDLAPSPSPIRRSGEPPAPPSFAPADPRPAGSTAFRPTTPAILREPLASSPAHLAQQVSLHVEALAQVHALLEQPSTPKARLALREAVLGLRVFVELFPSDETSMRRGLRKVAAALRPLSTCDQSTLRLAAWHAHTTDPTQRAVLELVLDRTETSTRDALHEARHRLQGWSRGPTLRSALLDHLDRTTGRMLRTPVHEADFAPRVHAYIERTMTERSAKGSSGEGMRWRLRHAVNLMGFMPPQLDVWLDASQALAPLAALRSTTAELRRTLAPVCVSLHEGLAHVDRELARQEDEAHGCLRAHGNVIQRLGAG